MCFVHLFFDNHLLSQLKLIYIFPIWLFTLLTQIQIDRMPDTAKRHGERAVFHVTPELPV